MKIAVWHNLPSGGGKRALYDHVKGLVGRGHHVESWCPPTADRGYLPLNDFITEHVVPLHYPARAAQRWLGNTYGTTISQLAAMERHCEQCGAEMRQKGFDVLLANPCRTFRTSPIAKFVDFPKVIYLQEPYRFLYEATPQLPWVATPRRERRAFGPGDAKAFIVDWARTQALRVQMREEIANATAFDLILVNSLFSRESLLRAYGVESKVCYLGIGPEFSPTGEARETFILGLGGLSYAKGADRAIMALSCIPPDARPELVWVANVSDPEHKRELEHLAAAHDVRFTIQAMVSQAELVSLLSRAAMLLYTSRLEPFGLAPLEANACRTPVVAIAEGGVRETIVHECNGLLVDGNDPRRIAAAIQRLINVPEFGANLGERGLRLVRENWNVDLAINRVEAALFRMIEQRNCHGVKRVMGAAQ